MRRRAAMVEMPLSKDAIFRYSVVAMVRARMLAGIDRDCAIAEVAEHSHATLEGELRKISSRALKRWTSAFEALGVRGLEPRPRPRTGTSLTLEEDFIHFIAKERGEDARASIPELLRRAKQRGLIETVEDVDRTTVWRAMKRMRLPTGRVKTRRDRDMRRFAFPHRTQMFALRRKTLPRRRKPTQARRACLSR